MVFNLEKSYLRTYCYRVGDIEENEEEIFRTKVPLFRLNSFIKDAGKKEDAGTEMQKFGDIFRALRIIEDRLNNNIHFFKTYLANPF